MKFLELFLAELLEEFTMELLRKEVFGIIPSGTPRENPGELLVEFQMKQPKEVPVLLQKEFLMGRLD